MTFLDDITQKTSESVTESVWKYLEECTGESLKCYKQRLLCDLDEGFKNQTADRNANSKDYEASGRNKDSVIGLSLIFSKPHTFAKNLIVLQYSKDRAVYLAQEHVTPGKGSHRL